MALPARRAIRVARFPLLLAYALMLAGSPVGEAGFLWVHLASAHGAATPPVAMARAPHPAPASGAPREHAPPAHEHGAGHEHAHEHRHEHPREPRATAPPRAPADEPRSPSPGEPHRHGGMVHDHQSHPADEIGRVPRALSRYYLPPPAELALPLPAGARFARLTPRTPPVVAARIETPPPQLPG